MEAKEPRLSNNTTAKETSDRSSPLREGDRGVDEENSAEAAEKIRRMKALRREGSIHDYAPALEASEMAHCSLVCGNTPEGGGGGKEWRDNKGGGLDGAGRESEVFDGDEALFDPLTMAQQLQKDNAFTPEQSVVLVRALQTVIRHADHAGRTRSELMLLNLDERLKRLDLKVSL